MKSVLLVGLGTFGTHIALQLNRLGHQVMGVDRSEDRVNEAMDIVTNAQIGDSTNEAFLRTLGIDNYDFCAETVSSSCATTVSQMLSLACRRKAKSGLDLIIVDHMGLMDAPGIDRNNRNTLLTEISRGLKLMAEQLQVPVLALCQQNRDIDKRGDGVPKLSDLRDSGSIEQDADGVWFLRREQDELGDIEEVTLHVAKNRMGPVAFISSITFIPGTTKFVNAERRN